MTTRKPSRSVRALGAALVFLVAAGCGWILGRSATTKQTEARPDPGSTKVSHRKAREQSSRALQQVAGIRRGATSEQRLRATLELATTLAPSEFASWMDLRWFTVRSGYELTLFRRIIEDRWRREDPQGFLTWCVESEPRDGGWDSERARETVRSILTEWAVDAPERLAEYFRNNPNDVLEAQVIANLAAEHPELALQHLQELLARGNHSKIVELRAAVEALAKSEPAAITNILDELPASLRLRAETTLVGVRLKESFETEIRALWDRADGWELFYQNLYNTPELREKLLAELPNLPADWISALGSETIYHSFYNSVPHAWYRADLEGAGFTTEQAARIRSGALRVLSSRDPELALDHLLSSDLDERARSSVLSQIFHKVRTDPAQAETLLVRLTSAEDRAEAERILTPRETPVSPPVEPRSPPEWLADSLARSQGDPSSERLGAALERWDAAQIAQFTISFETLPGDQKDRVAERIREELDASHSRAPELVGAVIRHFLDTDPTTPEGSQQVDQAARWAAIRTVQWALDDAPAATAWIQTLPDGEGRNWAELNLAATLSLYDPQAMEQWLQTLPVERQTQVREFTDQQPDP